MNDSDNFHGLKVLSLESRMAEPMRRLIEKHAGSARVAPSLREVPRSEKLEDFWTKLKARFYDHWVAMTGVGLRYLLKNLDQAHGTEVIPTLNQIPLIARGPKPSSVAQMKGLSLKAQVPEPHTSEQLVDLLDELKARQIALIEYGRSDPKLLATLQRRGIAVDSLSVYEWALPEDLGPLREAAAALIAGEVDVLLLTSAVQILQLLQMVPTPAQELKLRRALERIAIFSIGPATSDQLRELQIYPDFEVKPHKMENLVASAAEKAQGILEAKRERWSRIGRVQELGAVPNTVAERVFTEPLLLRALRGEVTERVPIWLMRQAGRYQAEYQLLRSGRDFLKFCRNPELCAEATLMAVERLGVDAGIIFSDILLPLDAMGLKVQFLEQRGPVFAQPLRRPEDLARLQSLDTAAELPELLQAIRWVSAALPPTIPLLGFAGAPFTLAAYAIEGASSRDFRHTKLWLYQYPEAWRELMERLSEAVIQHLKAQIDAGCAAVQLFDTWAGCLSPQEYEAFAMPFVQEILSALPEKVPTIYFATAAASHLPLQIRLGASALSLDYRVDLAECAERLGLKALQGNLDPALLFAEIPTLLAAAAKLLRSIGPRPGYVFNLGHGILPETPVDHVRALVDFVQEWRF